MNHVIAEIASERRRQIEAEGFNPAHDDQHRDRSLVLAAMGYIQAATMPDFVTAKFSAAPPVYWPWDPRWWKPKDRRRDLIRAAALIVAEVERIDRGGA